MHQQGKYACQHGPDECQLNRVLACGIAIKPNQADWFPFASCLEGRYPDELAAVEDCAKAANLDLGELNRYRLLGAFCISSRSSEKRRLWRRVRRRMSRGK